MKNIISNFFGWKTYKLNTEKFEGVSLLVHLSQIKINAYLERKNNFSIPNLNPKNIIWKGYPYIDNNDSPNYEKNDEMLKKDLDKIGSEVDKHKRNVLVKSHVGPFSSNTL